MNSDKIRKLLTDPTERAKLPPQQLQELLTLLKSATSKLGLGKTWSSPAQMAYDLSHRLPGLEAFNPAKHIDLLDSWLVDMHNGEKDQLLISFPPRHGKTELTVFWQSIWFLHKNPTKHIMFITHGATVAEARGARVRNFIAEHGQEVGLLLDKTRSSRGHWFLESGGSMLSVGAGGQIRGLPADLLVGDDLVKGMEQARSKVERDSMLEWWQGDALNRLEPKGKIILIGSRYMENDIMGVLEMMSDKGIGLKFHSFKLPAVIETQQQLEEDLMGRKMGEVLWPERINAEFLARIKKGTSSDPELGLMNPYLWGAVFQQDPTPEENAAIKPSWWKYYEKAPLEFDEVIQSWDMAFKDTSKADFVVGQVWGRKGAECYLLDQIRERLNFPETVNAVRNLKSKWPDTRHIHIEEAANGYAVIQTLHREIPGVVPDKTGGKSKEARLQAVTYAIEAGNIYLPSYGLHPWVHEFIREHSVFPSGAHDDQCDATSQALKHLLARASKAVGSAHTEAIGHENLSKYKTTAEIQTAQFHKFMKKKVLKAEKAMRSSGSRFAGMY